MISCPGSLIPTRAQGNCYEKTSENHGEVPSNLVQEQKKCLELYSKQENLSARSPYLGFNDCALVTRKHSPRWAPDPL